MTADALLIADLQGSLVTFRQTISLHVTTPMDLVGVLNSHRIDALVCGGLGQDVREILSAQPVTVLENVACSAGEIVPALEAGRLQPGFGLVAVPSTASTCREGRLRRGASTKDAPDAGREEADCLRCPNPVCLRGEGCRAAASAVAEGADPAGAAKVLEAAADISLEPERRLCRLAELVYFCLEMDYRRIGVAFCVDLREAAGILAGVLGRFFEVTAVCCKIGGIPRKRGTADPVAGPMAGAVHALACNPLGQADALNRNETDLNVAVGLCVGADFLFAEASRAPVTTLFVKDKSLANNPIGAVHSEYHLRESLNFMPERAAARSRSGLQAPIPSKEDP
jgi:uncharacterized metal-binding protein